MADTKPLFPDIGSLAIKAGTALDAQQVADDVSGAQTAEDRVVQEVESLCMNCREQGVTRLMLTSIPYFREVIVMSFRCEHCGTQNNEIQAASTIREEGTVYTARILDRSDLDRQIVRSPTCEVAIPELQLTLPPTQRGQLTTVEGLIRDVYSDLNMDQPLRRIQDPDGYNTIQALLDKLKAIIGDEDDDITSGVTEATKASAKDLPMPSFTLKLDDPTGNSWIEFIGSMADPKWNMRQYRRTYEQNVALGLVADEETVATTETVQTAEGAEEVTTEAVTDDEVFVFHGHCSSCGHPLDTKMKKVTIPYFKDILIMSTNCDRCGYRDNEVKSGSAISEKGKRIILKVEDREDLSRDILKSETAGLTIPEIDLVLQHGTLGGRFTTLEGILNQVYEELSEKVFAQGDAPTANDKVDFETFLKNLKEVKNAERPFTVILDDPLANSYMQNLYAPDPDPNMTIETYDRTWEQNEELGLNDIKVEGYEEDAQKEADAQKAAEVAAEPEKVAV
ncbi:putative zinc-finger protein zpr1 [Lyophyllum shimeji]|uniref:Zinc-finger protein zpr1 n=1 Tax=Lyophyllum shimeji TaxID=47721 RepID=A0A9P3UMM2_LYOSH|nr:putative zinc-finger protein zpr1 [Lyophyllum shimeji]